MLTSVLEIVVMLGLGRGLNEANPFPPGLASFHPKRSDHSLSSVITKQGLESMVSKR